jgi:hypothetical protein
VICQICGKLKRNEVNVSSENASEIVYVVPMDTHLVKSYVYHFDRLDFDVSGVVSGLLENTSCAPSRAAPQRGLTVAGHHLFIVLRNQDRAQYLRSLRQGASCPAIANFGTIRWGGTIGLLHLK